MPLLSPEAGRLLAATSAPMPLVQADLRSELSLPGITLQKPESLFPRARHGQAALAGLLLRAGKWAESHAIARDLHSIEGSYWHGIIHRMEPDDFNADYWFQRVGRHAIFPELSRRTAEILANGAPMHWRLENGWDPFLFVEWCKEARANGGLAESAAIEIQMAEWQLLFNWCAGASSSSC